MYLVFDVLYYAHGSSSTGFFALSGFESLAFTKKITPILECIGVFSGGEQGIRTLETVLAVYTISSRAPSTNSDNSPYVNIHLNAYILYITPRKKSTPKLINFNF